MKINKTFDFFIKCVVKKKCADIARGMSVSPERVHEMKSEARPNLSYATIEKFCLAFEIDVIDFYLVYEAFKAKDPSKFLALNKNRFKDKGIVTTVLEVLEKQC